MLNPKSEHPKEFAFYKVWSSTLERNPHISMDNIEDNWDIVSMLPNLNEEFILMNRDELNWELLSMNSVITEAFMLEYSHLPWRASNICYNPNMNLNWFHNICDWLSISKEADMVMSSLSCNPVLTFDFLVYYSHLKWDTELIREKCPLITEEQLTYYITNLKPFVNNILNPDSETQSQSH